MRIPNAEEAIAPRRKILLYLLSPDHPDGQHKAVFFRHFGFHPAHWEKLAASFKQHAIQHEVTKSEETQFGMRYTVDGVLECPDGRTPLVRSVWFIRFGETIPVLVTAFPSRRRKV